MKNTSLMRLRAFSLNRKLRQIAILLLVSTLISFTDVYAQSEKSLLGLSGGAAFPMGDFASTDINNESAGYAKTGMFYDISYVRFLNKGFGITGMVRGQSNDLDIQKAVQKFDLDMEASATADSKPWKNWSILAGVYNSYPIGKANKAFFESRAMIGYMSATSPEINMKFTFPDGEGYALNVKESSVTASAFTYLFGIGFRYNIGKKLFLFSNLDYQGAKPNFKDVKISMYDSYDSYDTAVSVEQNISALNLGIGIGIRF